MEIFVRPCTVKASWITAKRFNLSINFYWRGLIVRKVRKINRWLIEKFLFNVNTTFVEPKRFYQNEPWHFKESESINMKQSSAPPLLGSTFWHTSTNYTYDYSGNNQLVIGWNLTCSYRSTIFLPRSYPSQVLLPGWVCILCFRLYAAVCIRTSWWLNECIFSYRILRNLQKFQG